MNIPSLGKIGWIDMGSIIGSEEVSSKNNIVIILEGREPDLENEKRIYQIVFSADGSEKTLLDYIVQRIVALVREGNPNNPELLLMGYPMIEALKTPMPSNLVRECLSELAKRYETTIVCSYWSNADKVFFELKNMRFKRNQEEIERIGEIFQEVVNRPHLTK